MLNRLDYSYNEGESIMHRLNPLIKLFGLFIYVLVCLLKFNNLIFIFSISLVFMLMLFSDINIFKYIKIIWKFKYILIILYIFMYRNGVEFIDINILVFKIIFIILYIFMIIYTTTKEDLGKSIATTLNIFNVIGISIKKISSFIIDLFVYVSYFIDSLNEFITSLEIKGNIYNHNNLIGKFKICIKNFKKIFINTSNKMQDRRREKKYRLYNSNVKSKYKYRYRLCIYDYIFVILNMGIILFYILRVR